MGDYMYKMNDELRVIIEGKAGGSSQGRYRTVCEEIARNCGMTQADVAEILA